MIGFSMGLWNSTDSVPLFDFQHCHTVGTVPKSNTKTNNATMSEHLQSPIEKQIMTYCWNRSDSVELFVSLLNFGTVPTV
jgi:hypothetical protein